MEHPGFFNIAGPFSLRELLEKTDSRPGPNVDTGLEICDVRSLDEAGAGHISFFKNSKYLKSFEETHAAACFVAEKYSERAPEGVAALVSDEPYRSFALSLAMFYPEALCPRPIGTTHGAFVEGIHPSAEIEENVTVEPGAVIGPEARIGKGTIVAAGAVIGYRVCIGRKCYIGPNSNIIHTLLGDRVILHAGVCVGQDGFGFALSRDGHLKVPQIGRVIIQDNVDIGANCAIDRGTLKDTIIGEGTRIDNMVQIGHNVVIGRHCVIVAQGAIAGSAELGDGVVLGGQVAIAGHIKIGSGAQIAAASGVRNDVPPGARWGGTPAKPMLEWAREIALVKKLMNDRAAALRNKGRS